jgi:hypothetical protein
MRGFSFFYLISISSKKAEAPRNFLPLQLRERVVDESDDVFIILYVATLMLLPEKGM